MERTISGLSKEQYKKWLEEDMDELRLRNESQKVDDVVASMKGETSSVSSFDAEEYRGFVV